MTARQLLPLLALVSLLPFMSSCGDNPKAKSPDVITRLCQHIVQKRQKMIVDTNQAEIVWSDGAILEVATNFPGGLQELISRPTHYHDIRSFLAGLDAKSSQWKDASVTRSSRGDSYATVRTLDGKISTTVESIYVEYLGQRYPAATIRMRGELDPIIFVLDGEVHASLMPVKF
jgi:hypothetical protein